jgi:hypothetical protein
MEPSRAQMDRIVDDHFKFEATDDIDGIMASFADGELRHEIIPSPVGLLHEKRAMADYYKMLFSCAKGDKVTNIRRLYGEDFLVAETLWEGERRMASPSCCPAKAAECASGSSISSPFATARSRLSRHGLT